MTPSSAPAHIPDALPGKKPIPPSGDDRDPFFRPTPPSCRPLAGVGVSGSERPGDLIGVTGEDGFEREVRRCSAAPPLFEVVLVTIALGSLEALSLAAAVGGGNGGDEIAGLLAEEVEGEQVPTAAWDVVEGDRVPLEDRPCCCCEVGGVLDIAPVAEMRRLFTVLLSAWKTDTRSPHGRPDSRPALAWAIAGLVGETGEGGSLPSFAWVVNVEWIDESDNPRRRNVF